MTLHPTIRAPRRGSLLIALALTAALSGCDSMANNRLLDSIHQPVVAHDSYQLDLVTGPDGLAPEGRARLEGWFDALDLRYGDRIAIDDPLGAEQTRIDVAHAAARHGLLVGTAPPPGPGVGPGTVRVVVTRAVAGVPHCPDLATKSESNFNNATSSNYGCAVNSDLAAMVANPDDLLVGARHGPALTAADDAARAIWMHQAAPPTGSAGVTKNSTN